MLFSGPFFDIVDVLLLHLVTFGSSLTVFEVDKESDYHLWILVSNLVGEPRQAGVN